MTKTLRILTAALLTTLAACAAEVDGVTPPAGEIDELPATGPDVEQPAPTPPTTDPNAQLPTPEPETHRCLTVHFDPACVGQWADNSDRFSRWRAHPVTGLGTFPCQVVDGQCDKPWYADARCVSGAKQLAETCADVGGVCQAATPGGVSYCAAR